MMLPVLGFDAASSRSTDNAPTAGGGLLSLALDPEAIRQRQEAEALLDYVTERCANFIEPEIDLIH